MADYIQEMNSLRQRLQHMGPSFVIDDTSMSQVLLMGVCAVHREIVTQFDFSYRQGNPPTLQQVRNALLSRDEMEKMAADSAVNNGTGSSAMMHVSQTQGQNTGRGSGKPGGGQGPWARPHGQGQTTGVGNRRAIRCFHCKKMGHLRKDYWYCKQIKAQGKKNKPVGIEKKQTNKSDNASEEGKKPATGAMGYMRFIAEADANESNSNSSSSSEEELQFIGMAVKVARRGPRGDWMLDSGASTHVCIEKERFTSFKKSSTAFQGWDGGISQGNLRGSVVINAIDSRKLNELTLVLNKVEYSPSGPVNSLSLGRMLAEGWEMSTSPPNELPKKGYLSRRGEQLEFIFHGTHIWLNTGNFGELGPGVIASVNADASPLLRWPERLAHLNEASLKFMVKNDIMCATWANTCGVWVPFATSS
ncbi:unnamed protein product [Phytophthora fragariaefolia]|uniref:Unnamed protein product n=1 Tax=Phytophthora fragariaefolia TaxID=1490495 RepID=A0A9W7DAK5_9STRA|nr:unnamed protein product [Phytophthora fragariaefolia]